MIPKNREEIESINIDEEIDVKAAYEEKVAEHAEVMASSWNGDWKILLEKFMEQTGTSLEVAMMFQLTMFVKDMGKTLHNIEGDIGWLHAHYHDTPKECGLEKYIEELRGESWKK